MGSSKKAAPPPKIDPSIEANRLAKEAADAKAAADAKIAADKVAAEKAARDKAIQGGESASDIAARERSTLANPKKAKTRGQRSLVSSDSIGTGVSSSRSTLG